MNSLPSLNHKTSEDVTVGVRVESFVGVVRYGIVPTVPGRASSEAHEPGHRHRMLEAASGGGWSPARERPVL